MFYIKTIVVIFVISISIYMIPFTRERFSSSHGAFSDLDEINTSDKLPEIHRSSDDPFFDNVKYFTYNDKQHRKKIDTGIYKCKKECGFCVEDGPTGNAFCYDKTESS